MKRLSGPPWRTPHFLVCIRHQQKYQQNFILYVSLNQISHSVENLAMYDRRRVLTTLADIGNHILVLDWQQDWRLHKRPPF